MEAKFGHAGLLLGVEGGEAEPAATAARVPVAPGDLPSQVGVAKLEVSCRVVP